MTEIHLVAVKTYDNSFDANLAKSKLESRGINAFVENENNILNLYTPVKVMVSSEDVFEAINILDSEDTLED